MKIKRLVVMWALAMIGISTIVTPIATVQNVVALAEETTSVDSRSYILEWRYKVMDGHFYKRLYNATTGEWETDWILVQ